MVADRCKPVKSEPNYRPRATNLSIPQGCDRVPDRPPTHLTHEAHARVTHPHTRTRESARESARDAHTRASPEGEGQTGAAPNESEGAGLVGGVGAGRLVASHGQCSAQGYALPCVAAFEPPREADCSSVGSCGSATPACCHAVRLKLSATMRRSSSVRSVGMVSPSRISHLWSSRVTITIRCGSVPHG